MIAIKNEQELLAMRQACKITAAARALAGEMVRPGVSTKAIDRAVREFILEQGAKPSFLHYNGFPASACISVNNVVIHGIPGGYKLQEGDIVSIDVERFGRVFMVTVLPRLPAEPLLLRQKSSFRSRSRAFSRA